jgi:thiamine kinase-like enzyme
VGGRRLEDPKATLHQVQAALGSLDGDAEPLTGGITNRNFRVRLGGRDCVLRLAGKDTSLLGIDRETEWLANTAAAELGIAPRVLAHGDGWIVTQYMHGIPAEAVDLRTRPEAVAAALRRFHDSGVELPIRFWVPDLLEAYAEVVRERGGQLPEVYEQARQMVRRIAARLAPSEPVPCHNDLLPANVLRVGADGEVMLVDWEYAGMGHRMFDLGNLAVNSELGEAEEARLLDAYLGRPPHNRELACLRLMRIMSDAREAAWGVVQGVVSELDFDFAAYARQHFERLRAAAEDPRLEEWLDAAAA